MAYARGDMGGVLSGLKNVVRNATTGKEATEVTKRTRTSAADAISWSGCKDTQTSADTTEAGRATGAMSWVSAHAFLLLLFSPFISFSFSFLFSFLLYLGVELTESIGPDY